MGSILGGVAGIAGGILGGNAAEQAANKAAQTALTGYNYLTSGAGAPFANNYLNAGQAGLAGQTNALGNITGSLNNEGAQLGNQQYLQSQLAGLLGVGTSQQNQQAQGAYNNYLNSTGYQFQLQQGQKAVNSNAAASGMLQSGANAKALTSYGQNLASTTFNNYLGQLGGLNSAYAGLGAGYGNQAVGYGNQALGYGNQAGMGENMLNTIAQQGTQGGAAAAQAQLQGGQAAANMFGGAGGAIGNMFGNMGSIFNGPSVVGASGLST